MKRKLTTVFCADVHRYSTLMAADEDATLARLKRYREIMATLFDRHDGRQVNTWGDAVIAEFASVVEAVRCALAIQDALGAENRDLPEPDQMWLRIGINLGDVMHDDGDLYGDGVNVAARLESMAEPGGILVSEPVYSMVRKQFAVGFDFAGHQTVKGIDEAIPVYSVRTGGSNRPGGARKSGDEADKSTHSPLKRGAAGADSILAWLKQQPWSIRFSAAAIGCFAALNLLFTGIADPWFIYPSAPFALYIYVHHRRQKARRPHR